LTSTLPLSIVFKGVHTGHAVVIASRAQYTLFALWVLFSMIDAEYAIGKE